MRRITLLAASYSVVCLFLSTVLSAGKGKSEPVPAGDWPHWRGPHFDGVSRETSLLKQWPEGGPRVLWKVELSGGYSSVAVAGGRLYTHTARPIVRLSLPLRPLGGGSDCQAGFYRVTFGILAYV